MADEEKPRKRTKRTATRAAASKTEMPGGRKPGRAAAAGAAGAAAATTKAARAETAKTGSAGGKSTARKATRGAAPGRTAPAGAARKKVSEAQKAAAMEQQERAELTRTLREGSRVAGTRSQSDMAAGLEAIAAAEAVANLSREIGECGAQEVLAGRRVLAVSQDIASESLVVRALSREDLNIGLALAGIAGQLQSVTGVADSLDPSVLTVLLKSRGEQLRQIADTMMRRASATDVLARTLAETSIAAAGLGGGEMAEGRARLTVADWDAAESQALADDGLGLMAMGLAEAVAAENLEQQAEDMAAGKAGAAAEAGS